MVLKNEVADNRETDGNVELLDCFVSSLYFIECVLLTLLHNTPSFNDCDYFYWYIHMFFL